MKHGTYFFTLFILVCLACGNAVSMQKSRGSMEDLAVAKALKDQERIHAERKKNFSESRLSGMQKEYARQQHYALKVTNESPQALTLAVSIGTPERFNYITKPVILYPKKTWQGLTDVPSVIMKDKWPLRIQITTAQRNSLLLFDKKNQQRVAEYIISNPDDAIEYLEGDAGKDYYHWYIRKPEDKNYYEIMTPAEYRKSHSEKTRYEYYE